MHLLHFTIFILLSIKVILINIKLKLNCTAAIRHIDVLQIPLKTKHSVLTEITSISAVLHCPIPVCCTDITAVVRAGH